MSTYSQFDLESLEPRLLLSSDVAGLLALAHGPADGAWVGAIEVPGQTTRVDSLTCASGPGESTASSAGNLFHGLTPQVIEVPSSMTVERRVSKESPAEVVTVPSTPNQPAVSSATISTNNTLDPSAPPSGTDNPTVQQLTDTLHAANGPPGILTISASNGGIDSSGIAQWVEQGPNEITNTDFGANAQPPSSGAVQALAVNPSNPAIVFIGAATGGIWRTTDATADLPSWKPLTDQAASLAIGALAYSPLPDPTPNDPSDDVLFAGTGNFTHSGLGGKEDAVGLLMTTNGGATWSQLGAAEFSGLRITSVLPTTSNGGQVILVGTTDSSSDRGGLYRTADGGQHWQRVSGASGVGDQVDNDGDGVADNPGELNFPLGDVTDLVSSSVNGSDPRFYAAVPGKGVYASKDGGATWQQINAGLTGVEGSTRIRLAVSQSTGTAYAGIVGAPVTTLKSLVLVNDVQMTVSGLTGIQSGDFLIFNPVEAKLHSDAAEGTTKLEVGDASAFKDVIGIIISGPLSESFNKPTIDVSSGTIILPMPLGFIHPAGTLILGVRTHAVHVQFADSQTNKITLVTGAKERHEADETVYALGPRPTGIFRLAPTDAAAQWVPMSLPGTVETGNKFFGLNPDGGSDLAMAADPTDPNIVYVGGNRQPDPPTSSGATNYGARIFRGDFKAATNQWEVLVFNGANGTAPHPDSRNMVVLVDAPTKQRSLLEVDDGGVYRLSNADQPAKRRWSFIGSGVRVSEMYGVGYDPLNHELFAGFQDNGSAEQRSTNNDSLVWSSFQQGDGFYAAAEVVDKSKDGRDNNHDGVVDDPGETGLETLRFTTDNQDITGFKLREYGPGDAFLLSNSDKTTYHPVRLSDGDGISNSGISADEGNDDNGPFLVRPMFALNAVDPKRMIVGLSGLYESFDYGATVTRAQRGDSKPSVTALVYGGRKDGQANGDVMYVARGDQIYVRTTANGSLSKAVLAGADVIRDIVLDPDNWQTAYAVDSTHVFVTHDAGKTWQNITGPLPISKLLTVELMKTSSGNVLLAGGLGGVYRSFLPTADSELRWAKFGANFPNALVTDLHYDATDDVLVAATRGRGAWILPKARAAAALHANLVLNGGSGRDVLRLAREPDNPLLLDVYFNATDKPSLVLPLAAIEEIDFNGGDGNDSLILDSTNGVIKLPAFAHFAGGIGTNAISLQGAGEEDPAGQPDATGSGANVVMGRDGAQIVQFTQVSLLTSSLLPSDATLLLALRDGLEQTVDWSRHFDDSALLGQSFPLIGVSLGRALNGVTFAPEQPVSDPSVSPDAAAEVAGESGSSDSGGAGSSILRRLIEEGTGGFDLAEIGTDITSPQSLLTKLDALDDVPNNVTFSQSNGVTRFDMRVEKTLSGTSDLDLSALNGAATLHGQVQVSADVAWHLIFGADTHGFFITPSDSANPVVTVSNLKITGVHVTGQIGFLAVTLSQGALQTNPAIKLSIYLRDSGPDPFTHASDGLIRAYELDEPLGQLANAKLTGQGSGSDLTFTGTFAVAALLPGLDAPFDLGDAELSMKWADLGNPLAVTINASTSTGQDLLNFLHATPQNILDGLNKFFDFLDQFRHTAVFNTAVPFTGKNLGDILDFADAARKQIANTLESTNGVARFQTVQDFGNYLASLLRSTAEDLKIQYDSASHSLTYHVLFSASLVNQALPIDFSVHAGTLASFSTNSTVTVGAEVGLEFDFGVNLAAVVTGDSLLQDFFIKDANVKGAVTVDASNIDATAKLASLGIHINKASASAKGSLTIHLKDPGTDAADGRLSLRELTTALTNINSAVDSPNIQITGSFSLPVTADPFKLAGATVVLSGLVNGTTDSIDYSLKATVSGTFLNALTILPLASGDPSSITLTKANGLVMHARIRASGITVNLEGTLQSVDNFSVIAKADPFAFGGLTVALSGSVSGTADSIDYSLTATATGTFLNVLTILPLASGDPSTITLTKANGLSMHARARAFGLTVNLDGAVQSLDNFSITAKTDPFQFGGLTVTLIGSVSSTATSSDYSLKATASGTFLNVLTILPLASGQPSTITLTKASGLVLHARARAFGVTVNLEGAIKSSDDFSITATADPFKIGGVTVTLSGSAFSNSLGSDVKLTASVADWKPVSFLTIHQLTVTLDSSGLGFDATTSVAGVDGVHLQGDYTFDTATYSLMATAPVNWTLISGVNLSNVRFLIGNRNADGSQGDTHVTASADLSLFGTRFDVTGHITSLGAWIAASPKETFSPVPGLTLDKPVVIATTYDFVFDTQTSDEVPAQTTPQNESQRTITTGVDLVATSRLPDNIPGVGGSELQIAGTIGTELSQMALEAKLVLANPPEIAGLLAFDSIGLRITGEPSITIFGEGRVLHDKIPGMNQDIAIRAGLTLDIIHTTLSGSLSLLHELDNVFGVEGFDIIEGDGKFGINFGTTPLPLPTIGFNLVVNLPPTVQTLLTLPPHLAAALNISTTEPILAVAVSDWQPLAKLGLTNLTIKEGSVVFAPSGGTIGLKTFQPGLSATFIANLFGADVNFQGHFDEQTKGIALEAYVSALNIAGITITGAGPDGIYQDGQLYGGVNDPDQDNGSYFKADLTADKQDFMFSGRINLPGKDKAGNDAFIQLTGNIDSKGIKLDGQIQNWNVVPQILQVNSAEFALDISFSDSDKSSLTFQGDLAVLQTPINIEGKISSQGIEFTGSLKNPGSFAGFSVGEFTLSFSTLPDDEHLFVDLTIDLPGNGGLTHIHGIYQDQNLVFDANISDWQPISGLDFNGTLHAKLPEDASALDLDFDVTGIVLGVSTRFVGSLSSSQNGFNLFATALMALKLPSGQKVVDVDGTIDLGKDSTFAIGLGADFSLPGTRAADVHLEGMIGASGLSLYGKVDDWILVPGLAFDGFVKIHFASTNSAQLAAAEASIPIKLPPIVVPPGGFDPLPKPSDGLSIELDVSTSLLGSNLRLVGNLKGNGSDFDFDMNGHVHLGGPRVAGVSLDLDATVVTQTTQRLPRTKSYALAFSGDLQLFAGFDAIHVSASLSGDSTGNWTMAVQASVNFGFSATLDGIINFNIGVTISGTLSFSSNSLLPSVGLRVDGSASANVPKFGLKSTQGLHFGIGFDAVAGKATIPNARPKVKNNIEIVWNDYTFDTPEKDPAPVSVTATFIRPSPRSLTGTLQIRGTDAPERVQITRSTRAAVPGQPPPDDKLIVSAANGSGDLVQLLQLDTSSVTLIDIDMKGGNDTVTIVSGGKLSAFGVFTPTLIRGGLGNDTLVGGDGPNKIYGNRENAPDDNVDGDDVISGGRAGDMIFGGGGNDIIDGGGGSDQIDGGAGINAINGTLFVRGTGGPDHIVVSQQAGTFFSRGPFGQPSPAAIIVQSTNAQGVLVTLRRITVDLVNQIEVDAGGGDDDVQIQSNVTVATVINGEAGNDHIQTGGGPSTIHGGDGNDDLHGGAANDVIYGDEGDDALFGGGGDDALDGGSGNNTIHPGLGTNTVTARTADFILQEGGTDTIQGGNPSVTGTDVNDGALQRSRLTSITLRFNRDVSATLDPSKIMVVSAQGVSIDSSALALRWDATSNSAAITFPGLPGQTLPDGVFTVTLRAADVKDGSGAALSEFSRQVTVLTGDANGDGRTNDLDLYQVWQNQQKATATQDVSADLNGDGRVNEDDLLLAKDHYRTTAETLSEP